MPLIGTLIFALDIAFVIHAARSGRFWPWAYVIILLPGFGAAAYLFFELLPTWNATPAARKARKRVVDTVDPARRYRALRDELENVDTIGGRVALAQECLTLGENDEALGLYDSVIRLPLGDEPAYYLGKAKAEFGLERPAAALSTLEELKRQWPSYNSSEGHLLYARCLEDLDRLDEALFEYEALSRFYAGPEPRVRQALLLDRMDRKPEARQIAVEIVKRLQRSPKFVRKQNSEWLALAKTIAKSEGVK
jgi:hypothetical protein